MYGNKIDFCLQLNIVEELFLKRDPWSWFYLRNGEQISYFKNSTINEVIDT